MSCAAFEELLLDYPDLPAQERAAVDLHLMQCVSCRQYSDTLWQLEAALTKQFASVQPSELLHSRLHAIKTSRSPLTAPSFLPELLDLIGTAGIGLVLSLVLWKVFPIPIITDFVPIVGLVVPVCAGLVLVGIAGLGVRIFTLAGRAE
jgi:predicted anti-sigma-YlaC factor YlaD